MKKNKSLIFLLLFIIKDIYRVQVRDQTLPQMHQQFYCVSNRNFFSPFHNVSIAMSGTCSSAGRLFQTRWPWMAKWFNRLINR